MHGLTAGDAPEFDIHTEKAVQDTCLSLIRSGYIKSAHDVSDGGLGICLAEMSLVSKGLGAQITLNSSADNRLDSTLFGEAQSRIVVAVSPDHAKHVQEAASENGISAVFVGNVTASEFCIEVDGETVVKTTPALMLDIYESAIPNLMSKKK